MKKVKHEMIEEDFYREHDDYLLEGPKGAAIRAALSNMRHSPIFKGIEYGAKNALKHPDNIGGTPKFTLGKLMSKIDEPNAGELFGKTLKPIDKVLGTTGYGTGKVLGKIAKPTAYGIGGTAALLAGGQVAGLVGGEDNGLYQLSKQVFPTANTLLKTGAAGLQGITSGSAKGLEAVNSARRLIEKIQAKGTSTWTKEQLIKLFGSDVENLRLQLKNGEIPEAQRGVIERTLQVYDREMEIANNPSTVKRVYDPTTGSFGTVPNTSKVETPKSVKDQIFGGIEAGKKYVQDTATSAKNTVANNPGKTALAVGGALAGVGAVSMMLNKIMEKNQWRNEGCYRVTDPNRRYKCQKHVLSLAIRDIKSLRARCNHANNPIKCQEETESQLRQKLQELRSLKP